MYLNIVNLKLSHILYHNLSLTNNHNFIPLCNQIKSNITIKNYKYRHPNYYKYIMINTDKC